MFGWEEEPLAKWARAESNTLKLKTEAGRRGRLATVALEVEQTNGRGWGWSARLACSGAEDSLLLAEATPRFRSGRTAKVAAMHWLLHLDGDAFDVLVNALAH